MSDVSRLESGCPKFELRNLGDQKVLPALALGGVRVGKRPAAHHVAGGAADIHAL